jgi:hypothetical protein
MSRPEGLNTACLCPGTNLVLPEYKLGELQLFPVLNVPCANFFFSVLGINNDVKRPVDLNYETIVAICGSIALI